MPFIEQLLFGVDIKDKAQGRLVLSHSPGMGKEATDEIVRLCENWGTAPPLGLEHPALMSFRLNSTMPSLPGHLFTVIRASKGLNPLFHAVVMSEGTFATFLRNPFAVAQTATFCDEWNPEVKLQRVEIEYDSSRPLVDPPADKNDIGLVDEAVLKFLADGKLAMPIEQANTQSDRCLALIIACMPEKSRKDLRFASFAPGEANAYTLAGMATEGCVFAGWQRMMMAWLAGEFMEEVEEYIENIRKQLADGDLEEINRISQRYLRHSGPAPDSFDNTRRGTVSATVSAQGPPPSMAAQTPPPLSAPGRQERRATAPPQVAGAVRDPGRTSRSKPRKPIRLKRSSPGALTASYSRAFSRVRFIRGAFLVLILALAGTAGIMLKEGKTLAESLEWANLQGLMGEAPRTERAATLLEVVDVGDVYARQLKLVTSAGKGLNPSLDKGRNKAIGNLREDAAVPLNQQVQLFAKLAADGIQQGSRPDRESQRLKALASQGLVLQNELARLGLAWYSLAAGVFWKDLSALSDEAVVARCDSLTRVEKGALDDARRDLDTGDSEVILERTRGQVEGMASLLTLYEVRSWSPRWEKDLARAARSVSTTTSRMTRAYANSAFALLRLKRAERKSDQVSLPYCRELVDQGWPSAEIRSILINLRAQAAMFPSGTAPFLLTGTLDLYSALKKPVTLAAKVGRQPQALDDMVANRAVQFDPPVYEDFLARIRFEAALSRLEWSDDSALIPDHLYTGLDRELVIGFRNNASIKHTPEDWATVAAEAGIPFLTRWAEHMGASARVELDRVRREFDAAWLECRQTVSRMHDEAVAGQDWTESWTALDEQSQGILTAYAGVLASDRERAAKLADVTNLAMALKTPLPLRLEAGTIRLDQDRMLEQTRAVLEIRATPGGKVWRSKKFSIGPSAPAGTGWVGTVSLGTTLKILSDQGLEIKVISEQLDEILLTVTCPPLAEGVGPGGMVRPRSGGRGSVSLKIDKDYWKSLRVPDLGMIF